jgi:hypothetical protein
MAIYRITQEWTNFRVLEIEADTAELALEAVQSNDEGLEIDAGSDNHYHSVSVMDPQSGYFEEVV